MLDQTFHIQPRCKLAVCADWIVYPLIWNRLFTIPGERPQETHRWNNKKFPRSATEHLNRFAMVRFLGDSDASPRRSLWDTAFHRQRSRRAWKRFVVLNATTDDHWHIGWRSLDGQPEWAGASQIPIRGSVRMLIGPEDVEFFAVSAIDYKQLWLDFLDVGVLSSNDPYRSVRLL